MRKGENLIRRCGRRRKGGEIKILRG